MAQKQKDRTESPIKMQKYLRGVDYPVSKSDLRAAAEKNGAPQEVLEMIDRLPGEQFDAPTAVQKAFGEIR